MSFIRQLNPHEVEFSVRAQEETSDPKNHFPDDVAKGVLERLSGGNHWAWCEIVVHAKWNKFSASAYLNCCSYESKQDFIENSDAYEGMCMQTMNDLQGELEKVADRLAPLLTQESFDQWIVETTHKE